jgi:hypothetical protein
MTWQPDLFDTGSAAVIDVSPVRHTDPETCEEARKDALSNAARGRKIALDLLFANPEGLTDFELAELSGWQQTSIGKRRGELRDLGLVEDSGLRRPSPSGSKAIVWRVVETSNAKRVAEYYI